MNSIINSFFAKIIKSMEDRADEFGYNILVCTTDNRREKILKYLELVKTKAADGAVLLGIETDEEVIGKINEMSNYVSMVQCSEYHEKLNIPVVVIDNFNAMKSATEYMINKGRKNILHISCDNDTASTKERFKGYCRALAENNIKYRPELVIRSNYGYRSTLKLMADFLKKGIHIDAIVSNNDRMAAAAVNILMQNGYKIPEDIMVMGFDNSTTCYMMNPTLSSIAQPQAELGRLAFDKVYSMIKNEPFEERTVLGYEIKHKQTTNYGK